MNEKVEKAVHRFNTDLQPRYWEDWRTVYKELRRLQEVEKKSKELTILQEYNMPIALFDVDETLLEWYRAPTILSEVAKSLKKDGWTILIFTSRAEETRDKTKEDLAFAHVEYDALYMCPNDWWHDPLATNGSVKERMIEWVIADWGIPDVAFDDTSEACEIYRQEGIKALHVLI